MTVQPPLESGDEERHVEMLGILPEGPATSQAATRREIWGWYMFDFASNAFYAVALPVFFPLLLTWLANAEAYAELGQDATPECSAGGGAPCLVCVPGLGTQLNTTQGVQAYPQPQVSMGSVSIDPVAYASVTTGLAVLLQAFTFITLGPIGDYGRNRKDMLVGGNMVGALFCMLTLTLVSPSLWWLGGVYLILCNVAFGLSCVCFNSYLAVLVEAHPEVLQAAEDEKPKQEQLTIREKVSNGISLTAVCVGCVGALICILLTGGMTLTTSDQSLQLRLACAVAGLFWLVFTFFPLFWLQPRLGPPFPKEGLSLLCGWKRTWGLVLEAKKLGNAFKFLLCFFIYADGYTTLVSVGVLYGQRMMCMDNIQLILLVASVNLWAGIGALLSYWVQRLSGLHNKSMLVLNLALMVPLPVWGLVGYLTPEGGFGMKNLWEVYAFASWFGMVLGPMLSFTRVVFIDMIPVGTEATFFSLYSITDKGSSWLGPLLVALIVQATGDLRPSFWYILAVMVIPLVMLIVIVDHKKGMVESGRIQEHQDLHALQAE